MKKTATIFLLFYYSFGIFCLPMGDFSRMAELPKMYQHCNAEDPDIDLADFIGEHLLNLENIMDHFDHDSDEDKKEIPHQPYHFSISNIQTVCTITVTESIQPHTEVLILHSYFQQDDACLPQSSQNDIFHPPVTAG